MRKAKMSGLKVDVTSESLLRRVRRFLALMSKEIFSETVHKVSTAYKIFGLPNFYINYCSI